MESIALDKGDPAQGPAPGLRAMKKERQRRRIMATAVALIRERGFEATTVEEIVRRVQISQPTFYNYFGGKEDVLREVALGLIAHWARRVSEQLQGRQPVADKLRLLYTRMARGMSADKTLWRAIVLADALNPLRNPRQREAEAGLQELLVWLLAQGQQQGEISNEFSAAELADSLLAIQLTRCMAWGVDNPQPHELETRLMSGLGFFLRGARP